MTYDCMSADELALWRKTAPNISAAATPCIDCPAWFARQARAKGCCNGNPGRPKGRTGRPRKASVPVVLIGPGRPGYASEEERLAARRLTWRLSKRRSRES